MFRYGGPIKEGVMSGIREPHAGGGRAALVGNPVYPQTGGREHHNILKTIFGFGAKPALGVGAKEATKKTVGTETVKGIKSLWQKYGPDFRLGRNIKKPPNIKSAPHIKESIYTTKGVPFMEKAGRFVKKNPWWTAGGALYGSKPAYEMARGPGKSLVKTAADVAVPDWIYNWETGRWFNSDDTDLKPSDKKILDEKITEKVTEKIVPEVPQKTEEEIRAARIQKYRDIMDIKGMNKRAAYDSLIDASKLVGESEDFKGDIKSGKLINQIIQATSKQFDKPAKTRDAIDTLILKGEIEADIASGKAGAYQKNINTVASNLNISKEDATKMILNKPLNLREQVTSDMAATKQQAVTHRGIVSSTKKQYPKAQVMLTQDEYEDVVGDDSTGEAFVKTTVTDKLSKDPNAKVAGIYIVGKEVVQVDGAGHTLTLFP
jgi:hypothetical protein